MVGHGRLNLTQTASREKHLSADVENLFAHGGCYGNYGGIAKLAFFETSVDEPTGDGGGRRERWRVVKYRVPITCAVQVKCTFFCIQLWCYAFSVRLSDQKNKQLLNLLSLANFQARFPNFFSNSRPEMKNQVACLGTL